MAANDQINALVDIALELKQQIENRDIDKVKALFESKARINIYGRFYDLETFLRNLHQLLNAIEQPGIDITSVDESEIAIEKAFISVSVDLFWIDQKTWEEISQLATLSLELERNSKRDDINWLISGFTLARNKKVIEDQDMPLFPKDTKGTNFLDGIFNFWY
jgi:hypothetical protein